MSSTKPTLSDQIKEAERDKYLAEVAKLKVEKEKIEFDLTQAKKPKKKNYWEIITVVATISTLVVFYMEYGFKPFLIRDELLNEIKNARQEKDLMKLGDSLTKVQTNLTAETSINKHFKKENTDLSDSIKSKSHQVDSLSRNFSHLNTNKAQLVTEIEIKKRELNKYKNSVDSLMPYSFLQDYYYRRYETWTKIDFFCKGVDNANEIDQCKIITRQLYGKKPLIFSPRFMTGGEVIVRLIDEQYDLVIESKKYKIKGDKFLIDFRNAPYHGDTTINVELELLKK